MRSEVSTYYTMPLLWVQVRGIAAKACVLGPQLLLQTGGSSGFPAVSDCSQLQEGDFASIPQPGAEYIESSGEAGTRPVRLLAPRPCQISSPLSVFVLVVFRSLCNNTVFLIHEFNGHRAGL